MKSSVYLQILANSYKYFGRAAPVDGGRMWSEAASRRNDAATSRQNLPGKTRRRRGKITKISRNTEKHGQKKEG